MLLHVQPQRLGLVAHALNGPYHTGALDQSQAPWFGVHAANANAINGAQDMMHTTHSAGRSAGFYEALQWLYSQARIEFEQNIEISGADADQSATSAQQPSGEAALREHYSP